MFTCSMSAMEWDFGPEDKSSIPARTTHVISRDDFRWNKNPGKKDVAARLVDSWVKLYKVSDTILPEGSVSVESSAHGQGICGCPIQPGSR